MGCNKRAPGSGCAALAGPHERHAIFGWTDDCVAVQPSDPAVALAALDAQVDLTGPAGPRTIPMREFHLTPAQAAGDPTRETGSAPDELIVGTHPPTSRTARPTSRSANAPPTSTRSCRPPRPSCGRAVRSAARVALGSVAQQPWRLPAAEAELVGVSRSPARPCCRSIERGAADALPLPHNGFKVTMARNAAVRALLLAGGAR